MRWPLRRRLSAASLALAAAVPLLPTAPAQAYAALPGGRANYVVSVIDGKVNAIRVRLATYQFATDGTVSEQYWAWSQAQISGKGNARWTKVPTGYRTSGCPQDCVIRTPVGFQPGTTPRTARGTYYVNDRNVLVITWSTTAREVWRIDTSRGTVAGLNRVPAARGERGWGLGSNAPLTQAVDARTMYTSGDYFVGPGANNNYGAATTIRTPFGAKNGFSFRPIDNHLCSNGTCIENRYFGRISAYYAVDPDRLGRKMFYNAQTSAVRKVDGGTTCISKGGGHTDAMLQALDDNGRFVGLVGVEASLNARKPAQAVVGAFAATRAEYQMLGNPLLD